MAMLKRVDHLNVQVPPEKEDEAKHFYGEILGLSQLTKPDNLGRSGAHYCLSEEPWYELHLGIARGASVADIGLNQALLNHLGFQVDDLAAARQAFEAAGIEISEADPARSEERDFYQERFFVRDPGGNQLEIMESRRLHSARPPS
ncbi:MAG: catechol 2,3-dioxygenase-like lactoylglutathione lyase family enzyme [Alphaproteobacteria bacterium]|jgi:catechol 2,3-dioxygenase-like lactoylglutathione lyase family enzyme